MASTYMLEIVTPDKKFYSGEVELTIIRTSTGDMGIMKDHELMVAPLSIGTIKIKVENDMKIAACSVGFISVEEEKVTIVTDSAEWAEEIDVERAKAALERAKSRLSSEEQGMDVERAKISLSRAMNRVHVAQTKIDHTDL